jgi:hypothetical protein
MSIKNIKSNPENISLIALCVIFSLAIINSISKEWYSLAAVSSFFLLLSLFMLLSIFKIDKKIMIRLFGNTNQNLTPNGSSRRRAFIRVQNTINNGKVFVSSEEDGIYIRLAGNENEGEAFSEHKVKVYDYER